MKGSDCKKAVRSSNSDFSIHSFTLGERVPGLPALALWTEPADSCTGSINVWSVSAVTMPASLSAGANTKTLEFISVLPGERRTGAESAHDSLVLSVDVS